MHVSRYWIIAILLLLLMPQLAAAQATLEERGYLAYVPSTYEGEALPLLIVLHGFGDTAENLAAATQYDQVAERFGFAVVFPQAYLRQWNDGSIGDHYEDDTAIILELIELAADNIHIDRERIYLVGFSNGATMTFRAYCEAPDTFAGIAAVGGPMRQAQSCDPDAQTSVLIMFGTGDTGEPTKGGNGRYSSPETATYWAEHNGCIDEDVPVYDPDFEDPIFVQFYDECEEDVLVMLYAINRLGHTWPGAYERVNGYPVPSLIDANLIIWAFFDMAYQQQHPEDEAMPESSE